MKLPVHLMRSGSFSGVSMHLVRYAFLTLLNVDLTSMGSAPATFFPARACWVRFIRTVTALTQDLLFRKPNWPSCSLYPSFAQNGRHQVGGGAHDQLADDVQK